MKLLRSLKKRIAERRSFPALAKWQGCHFVLDPANWIDKRLVAGIDYEPRQIAMAKEIVARTVPQYFFDVGANFGLYSVLLGKAGVEKIYAFEPVRRNISQLYGNLFVNRLWDKVTVMACGLASEDGEAEIHIDPKSTGISRLDLETAGRNLKVFTQSEKIALRRFDGIEAFAAIAGESCFFKIDVEGHAPAVLSGMASFLARNKCHLQVELSESELAPAREILAGLGYRETAVLDHDFYFANGGEG